MINQVIITGNLTRDPELRFITGSGKAVCNMNVAVPRPNSKDKTDFLNVVVWGKIAENCSQFLSKGSKVAVEGSFQTGSYKNQEGETVYTNDIFAHKVEFLNSKKSDDKQDDFYSKTDDYQAIEDDDSVPF